MSQTSERQNILNTLGQQYEDAKRMNLFQHVIREDNDMSDDGKLGHLSYLDLICSPELLARAQSSRYVATHAYLQSTEIVFFSNESSGSQ